MLPVIILDLDKTGIEFISPAASQIVMEDKWRKQGWIKGKSAFLFADYNGSGCADFPEESELKTKDEPIIAGLVRNDINKDRRLDAQDPFYQQLYLWQDKNEDGLCTPTEVRSLTSYGISLEFDFTLNVTTVNDNKTVWEFSYSVTQPDQYGNMQLSKGHKAINAVLVDKFIPNW